MGKEHRPHVHAQRVAVLLAVIGPLPLIAAVSALPFVGVTPEAAIAGGVLIH